MGESFLTRIELDTAVPRIKLYSHMALCTPQVHYTLMMEALTCESLSPGDEAALVASREALADTRLRMVGPPRTSTWRTLAAHLAAAPAGTVRRASILLIDSSSGDAHHANLRANLQSERGERLAAAIEAKFGETLVIDRSSPGMLSHLALPPAQVCASPICPHVLRAFVACKGARKLPMWQFINTPSEPPREWLKETVDMLGKGRADVRWDRRNSVFGKGTTVLKGVKEM